MLPPPHLRSQLRTLEESKQRGGTGHLYGCSPMCLVRVMISDECVGNTISGSSSDRGGLSTRLGKHSNVVYQIPCGGCSKVYIGDKAQGTSGGTEQGNDVEVSCGGACLGQPTLRQLGGDVHHRPGQKTQGPAAKRGSAYPHDTCRSAHQPR